MPTQAITESLTWRYATKEFDLMKKLTDDQVTSLLEAARLSPSWYGLQPWKIILVENESIRTQLREASYGQPQVTEASHFVVLASKTTLDEKYIDTFIKSTSDAQGVSVDSLSSLKGSISQFAQMLGTNITGWASNQTHIALGILLETAALMRIDAAPMGGFDADRYDEILGLKELGLHAAVVCALGYRSEKDATATRAKSRFSLNEILIKR